MITIINGNPRPKSRTSHLAAAVGQTLADRTGDKILRTVDLASLDYRVLVPGDIERRLSLDAIADATLLIVATPTYKGSYTGVLKTLFDALPPTGLNGTAAVTIVTAGTDAQARSADKKLADLLAEVGATVRTAFAIVEAQLTDIDTLATRIAEQVIADSSMSPQGHAETSHLP